MNRIYLWSTCCQVSTVGQTTVRCYLCTNEPARLFYSWCSIFILLIGCNLAWPHWVAMPPPCHETLPWKTCRWETAIICLTKLAKRGHFSRGFLSKPSTMHEERFCQGRVPAACLFNDTATITTNRRIKTMYQQNLAQPWIMPFECPKLCCLLQMTPSSFPRCLLSLSDDVRLSPKRHTIHVRRGTPCARQTTTMLCSPSVGFRRPATDVNVRRH